MPRQTGPTTIEGKAKSSQNALKFGLYSARLFVLPNENSGEWKKHVEQWHLRLQPQDECERQVVADIAHAQWRIRRARYIEVMMYDMQTTDRKDVIEEEWASKPLGLEITDAFRSLVDSSNAVTSLQRYETAARRAFERGLGTLAKLRALAPTPVPPGLESVPEAATQKCKNEMPKPPAPGPVLVMPPPAASPAEPQSEPQTGESSENSASGYDLTSGNGIPPRTKSS